MLKALTLTTPAGIAVWPHLNKPDTKFNPDGDYRTGLRLTAEDAAPVLAKIQAIMDEGYATACKEKKNPKLKKADLPIKEEMDDDGNPTGNVVLNFKLKSKIKAKDGTIIEKKPGIFDAKGKVIAIDKTPIWGGSRIKVAFEAFAFYVPALGAGVSLRLKGVQVLELVSGGQTAEAMGFGKEDGYEAQAEETPPAAPKADETEEDGSPNVAARF